MNARYLLSLSCAALFALTGCSNKHCTVDDGISNAQTSAAEKDFSDKNTTYFHFNKSNLTEDAKKIVSDQSKYLKNHSDLNITVEGHADERGTSEYNMALGSKRAESVKKELINNGIDASKITTTSYGKERPVEHVSDSNRKDAEAIHAKNRRAVTVIS